MLFSRPRQIKTASGATATVCFVAGALLMLGLGYLHFHLWQSLGYRHIPKIGPLFLVQSVGALLLGLSLLALRRVWVAFVGTVFVVSTMLGFLVSVTHGLFGFQDSWSAPFAAESFVLDIAVAVVLLVAVALCLRPRATSSPTSIAA